MATLTKRAVLWNDQLRLVLSDVDETMADLLSTCRTADADRTF